MTTVLHSPSPRARRAWPRAWALAGAAVLAACYAPSAPLGIPCATNRDCPGGQMCNAGNVCGLPTPDGVWRDDLAADFAAPGAYTDEVTVEPAGFVGPAAYLAGGLRLTGIDRNAIPNASTTWSELAAIAPTGTTLARGFDLDYGERMPPGLGLPRADNITILVEGELDLNVAGTYRFNLFADDRGFIEIARPGSATFERVVTDNSSGTNATYQVTTPGWHRVRGAFADGVLGFELQLRYDPPDAASNFRRIPADRIRTRAGDLGGILVDGFDDAFLVGASGSVVHPGTLGGQTFGADPFGLPIGGGSYSLRFASQILIDIEGKYAFTIDSQPGHRAWLDGVSIADVLDGAAHVSTTSPVQLEPGWHDFVVDVHKLNGPADARLAVTVADGSPMWSGKPVPADHQRPIVGRGARWTAGTSTFTTTLPDQGNVVRTVTLDLPPGMTPARIDAGIEIDHPNLASVDLTLDPPAGQNLTFAAAGSLMGAGQHYEHLVVPVAASGTSWGFIANDTAADGAIGDLTYAAVTIIGAGGVAPFPTKYRYVSAPRDLGEVSPIRGVQWALRQARPDTAATVSIRTCDDAAACEAQPWTAVTAGAPPDVAPRRFAQYAIDLTSNGDVPTALDWIQIDFGDPPTR